MADKWVILELSSKAEGEDPDVVRKSIAYSLRGADVFIPAAVTQIGEDRVIHHLVEGYAFIRHRHPDASYSKLENSRYVQSVLTKTTGGIGRGYRAQRQLAFIEDSDIERMKRQIHVETDQGISVGDTVLITSGPYRQITAKVIEDIPELDSVQVHIQLRSKTSIVTLPRSAMRLETRAPKPPFMEKFEVTKMWFNDSVGALRACLWQPDTDPLRTELQRFESLNRWQTAMQPLADVVRAYYTPLNLELSVKRSHEVDRLVSWVDQWQTLVPAVQFFPHKLPHTRDIRSKYVEFAWLQQVQERLDALYADVKRIERKMSNTEYDNIVIDGLNLAMRVYYAPGMQDMKDKRNRPTGVVFGFLRSLNALLKRYPGASVTVCWDGSNRVRKALYPDYKGTRTHAHIASQGEWDQLDWLRENLPLFGVTQAWNDEEEADDVIASLIRGPLKGQRNAILSSDRDLLQLVSKTDTLITPAQGKRKETAYTPDLLKEEWGVEPSQMVTLRALAGDSSDDIPGVPTVNRNILKDLVHLYGTIDGIYSSNLAGLTRTRYERIKTSEKQVRLNEQLMTLRTIPYQVVTSRPNHTAASERLADVDVDAEPMLRGFFATGS